MGVSAKIMSHFRSTSNEEVTEVQSRHASSDVVDGGEKGNVTAVTVASQTQEDLQAGVSAIEAVQAIWGKKGFRIILFG